MEKFIIKNRILILVISLILSLPFAFLIPLSKTDPDLRNYIPADLPSRVNTNIIEEQFGNQNVVFIIISSDTLFTRGSLLTLQRIDNSVGNLEGIEKTVSLFNLKNVFSSDGMMVVEPCIPYIPDNDQEIEKIIDNIRDNGMAVGTVVSADLKSAAITAVLAEDHDETELLRMIDSTLLAEKGDLMICTGGLPIIRRSILSDVTRDGFILIPAGLVIMLLLLLWLFRNWRGMVLPFAMVLLSLIPTMGLVVLFGWKLSILSLLAPVMLIAIANNYGIHIVSRYNEQRLKMPGTGAAEAVINVVRSIKKPVLYTGITSIAGMLGLLMHNIVPAKHVGILTSIGIAWALILSIFLLPGLICMSESRASEDVKKNNGSIPDRLFDKLSDLITGRARSILIITLLVCLAGIAGIFLVNVDSNQENFFPKKHPVSVASSVINSEFGGSQGISVMIKGDMMDPGLLRSLDKWKKENTGRNGIGSVLSLADAVKIMSRGLYEKEDIGYDNIPVTRDGVAQMIELFNMSGDPDEFSSLADFSYTSGQLLIRLSDASNKNIKAVLTSTEKLTKEMGLGSLTGGYGYIMTEFAGSIVRGQIMSLIYAVIVIFFLLTLINRSVVGGIISSLPLLASLIIMFGFMGIAGIPLDSATALLSSIMIGVGVDYTIHYVSRHTGFSKMGYSQEESTRLAISSTGRGIVFNGLSVMAGFSVLLLSGFTSIRYFGYLTVISIGISLMGALLVIPSLLIVFKPRFTIREKS